AQHARGRGKRQRGSLDVSGTGGGMATAGRRSKRGAEFSSRGLPSIACGIWDQLGDFVAPPHCRVCVSLREYCCGSLPSRPSHDPLPKKTSVNCMSAARPTAGTPSIFPYAKWEPLVRHLALQYRAATPFPHLQLAPFLEPEVAQVMAADFPEAQSAEWIRYKHGNENKLGLNQRALFPPSIRAVVDELNSPPFVAWLSELTGMPNLIADPSLDGGGLHQVQRGGFLNVH